MPDAGEIRFYYDVVCPYSYLESHLVERTEDDLLAITNFGQKSLDEVIQKLDERGLSLRVKEA